MASTMGLNKRPMKTNMGSILQKLTLLSLGQSVLETHSRLGGNAAMLILMAGAETRGFFLGELLFSWRHDMERC